MFLNSYLRQQINIVDRQKTQIDKEEHGTIYKQGEKLRWLFTTHDTNQRRINFEA